MSLQVRLRHPLGDRLIELSPRAVQQPVVVGRAAGAEVQVPSVSVLPKHCLLFVHKGRWAVQDAGGGNTLVNGQPVQGATFLRVGDVIALGPDAKAATIEIDPEGPAEGRTGYATDGAAAPVTATAVPPARNVATAAARPAPAAAKPAPQGPTLASQPPIPKPAAATPVARPVAARPPAPPQPGAARVPQALPARAVPVAAPVAAAVPVQQGWDAAGGSDPDTVAWTAQDAGSSPATYRRRKQPRSSGGGGVVATVVLMMLVAGGGGYFLYQRYKANVAPVVRTTPATNVTKAPRSAVVAEPESDNIFGVPKNVAPAVPPPPHAVGRGVTSLAREITGTAGVGRRAAASATGRSASTASDAGAPQDVASPTAKAEAVLGAKDDARMKTAEWQSVTAAYYARNPLEALLKINDYEKTYPGVLAAQLATLREGTLDRLWFERIDQLWQKRQDLVQRLAQIDQTLVDTTDETFKKTSLIPEKQNLQRELEGATKELEGQMDYTGDAAPVITDDSQLDVLRRQRDPERYTNWKQAVIESVRRRGELPFLWEK